MVGVESASELGCRRMSRKIYTKLSMRHYAVIVREREEWTRNREIVEINTTLKTYKDIYFRPNNI